MCLLCLEHSPTSRMYCKNHWNHETVSETIVLKTKKTRVVPPKSTTISSFCRKKTFVLGTLLNLNLVGCPTKKCHCLNATELWWAYGTLEGLSSSKWIESSKATPTNSFKFTFTCFILFTYYNMITVLPFLYNMMPFLLGFFYKLGCIISCRWFFPISWLLIGACAWADTTVCRQVPDICKRAQYSFQDNNLKFCLVRAFSNHNSKACLSRNRVSFIMIWTCTWPDFISTHN